MTVEVRRLGVGARGALATQFRALPADDRWLRLALKARVATWKSIKAAFDAAGSLRRRPRFGTLPAVPRPAAGTL
jgi:hypothetical protein